MQNLRVRDWMTADPITISSKTSLQQAVKLMKKHTIRRLPVVDDGALRGIVSWGDLREASPSDATSLSVWEINHLLNTLSVDHIMTKNVLTVGADASVEEAARLMLEGKVSALPVLQNGRVIGIITESDIFRMVVAHWAEVSHTSSAVHTA